MCGNTSPRILSVTRAELQSALSNEGSLFVATHAGPLSTGDRIANKKRRLAGSQLDLWQRAKFDDQGRAEVGASSRRCHNVLIDYHTRQVANRWQASMQQCTVLHDCWPPVMFNLWAAADAYAQDTHAGIGCWICWGKLSKPSGVYWYSLQLDKSMLPDWWPAPDNLQAAISSFELVAQVGFLNCKHRLRSRSHCTLSVRFLLDSTLAEGAGNKLCSTNPRVGPIVLSLAHWSLIANVSLEVEHISGSDNQWADDLPGGHFSRDDFIGNNGVPVLFKELWTPTRRAQLIPQAAFWHPYVRALAKCDALGF